MPPVDRQRDHEHPGTEGERLGRRALPFAYLIDLLTEVAARLDRALSGLRRHGAPPGGLAEPVV